MMIWWWKVKLNELNEIWWLAMKCNFICVIIIIIWISLNTEFNNEIWWIISEIFNKLLSSFMMWYIFEIESRTIYYIWKEEIHQIWKFIEIKYIGGKKGGERKFLWSEFWMQNKLIFFFVQFQFPIQCWRIKKVWKNYLKHENNFQFFISMFDMNENLRTLNFIPNWCHSKNLHFYTPKIVKTLNFECNDMNLMRITWIWSKIYIWSNIVMN